MKTENPGAKDVFFHRVVRSMSGRDGTASGVSYDSENIPSLIRTQSTTSSMTSLSSQASRKRGFNVRDRLKRLSHGLPLKLRRSGKSEPASPRVTSVEMENTTGHGKMLSIVDERVEDIQASTLPSTTKTDDHSLSPTTLAQRLRDLIDPLPFPSYSQTVKPPKLPPRDKQGRPIPPQPSTPVNDSKLIELLCSATFMNGPRAETKSRPSVWELLEGLGVPPHGFPEQKSAEPDNGGTGSSDPPIDGQPDFTGTSSVMVYSPLIPGQDDIVELGELIPVSIEEETIYDISDSKPWTSIWPLSMLPGWPQFRMQAAVMEVPDFSEDFIVHTDVTTINESGKKVRLKTTSAWVPSTTKMSFQAMWWGYRLWLPPPVMAVLSDQSLEISKRASIIATALAWFFNNLPISIFPPQVQPALLLMQRIVPYLGYIATFISWSWGTVKSYDMGHGVTLTATWLLPIALIPGTWNEKDVPKSPTQSPPTTIPTSPTVSPRSPFQPLVGTPRGAPTTSLPTTSPASSQPQLSPHPVPGNSLSSTAKAVVSSDVPSHGAFARTIFAFLPTRLSATGSSELLPPTPRIVPRTPVQASSALGEELLHAPVLRYIPLPNESSETLDVRNKGQTTTPLFRRNEK